MCLNCWIEAGRPSVVNRRVFQLVDAIVVLYDEHPSGGRLHIQIDDWNLGDEYCRAHEFRKDYQLKVYTEPPTGAEIACLAALRRCTESERYSANRLAEIRMGDFGFA